jgi:hypothetical protein
MISRGPRSRRPDGPTGRCGRADHLVDRAPSPDELLQLAQQIAAETLIPITPAQQRPQTRRPSGQVVAVTPAASQSSLHVAWAPQVTAQSPRHLTSQFEVSLHATVLPVPRLSLQSELFEQVADDRAPAFSSHFEVATHAIMLASPPLPLHSELSLHERMVAPSEAALHFAPVSHRIVQPAVLHVVLQSTPAIHEQLFSCVHMQPAPVHVAGGRPASLVAHAGPARSAARIRPKTWQPARAVLGGRGALFEVRMGVLRSLAGDDATERLCRSLPTLGAPP